jgi:hypothetical protein
MMRKSFWLIALLFGAMVVPTVNAQTSYDFNLSIGTTGNIEFTVNASGVITGISGTYDGATIDSSISPDDWDPGQGADNLFSDTAPYLDTKGVEFALTSTDAHGDLYVILFEDPDSVGTPHFGYESGASTTTGGADIQYNNLILTPTITPEPSTAILWLTGIGLMILTRKRIAHYLRPAPGTHGSLSPH